jgi:hypothetical protein
MDHNKQVGHFSRALHPISVVAYYLLAGLGSGHGGRVIINSNIPERELVMTKQRKKPGKGEEVKTEEPAKEPNRDHLFKTGNGFWKLRTKHGRDRIFESPADMWAAACEYFEACENNPLYSTDFKGQYTTEVQIPKLRAFSMKRLCLFLGTNEAYFSQFKKTLPSLETSLQKDFSQVITAIEDTVFCQKFEGAAAGELNANLISRELGMADRLVAEVEDKRKAVQEAYPDILSEGMGEQV